MSEHLVEEGEGYQVFSEWRPLEQSPDRWHTARMEAYIAAISEPAFPDIGSVEERRLIVLASSPEAAEDAFDDYVDKNGLGGWSVAMTDEVPAPGYLQAAKLEPNVVKSYDP